MYATAAPVYWFISSFVIESRLICLWVALAVACRDVDVRNVKALIIGPPGTPYEFGFFEVCTLFSCYTVSFTDDRIVFCQVWKGYEICRDDSVEY